MNTAYNSTTTATDVTTTTQTQQPEPVATPEEVTTEYYGYLDGRDPMQIGRIKKQLDRRIYADGKICTWAEYIAEGYEAGQLKAYKDEYTYAKKGRDLAYHEHKVTEWVIWTAREMERGNGVVANKTIVDYARYLIKLMEATPATAPQATEEDTTTAPEEVQPVTTSKQEDGPAPYWLLLDQELQAQQEEQEPETAPATPEATKQEEPMHAPQMLKKIIEEQKRRAAEGTNTIPLKTAVGMTTEVLTPKRAKELLGDNFDDSKTYVLVDGSEVVRFERPELSKTLYIDDESPEYKEYQRGNISAVELYRNDAMRLNDPARYLDAIKHSPVHLKVIDIKGDVLVFTEYAGYHGYRIATPDEVEIYKAAAAAASEAFTKRLDSYIRRYGKKIYVHSYWANR